MSQSPIQLLDRWSRVFGPLLFVVSLLVYAITLSPGAFPGESARLIVQHTGIDPFPPMSHFLWGSVARVIALIPLGGLVVRLNLFSALCGAGAVWLLYDLVKRIPHNRTTEEAESKFPAGPVQTLSGLVAGLVLAFCVPFWIVSNRAHTASFDVLLLLFAIRQVVRFAENRRMSTFYLGAFLYGLGVTEFATFIVLAPVVLLVSLFLLWRFGLLRAREVLLSGLCVLAGLSVYFLAAWLYMLSPAYHWRSFKSYGMVLFYMWREQYRTVLYSLPQVGWLLVFLMSVLPFFFIVVVPKRALNHSSVMGSYFLHAMMVVLALVIVFNAPASPWFILRFRPLLVTPYVIMAIWIGYLAGYWCVYFITGSRFDSPMTVRIKRAGRAVLLPLIAVIVLVSAVLNYEAASGRAARSITGFAEQILSNMEGRTWLVSNGLLDDLIQLQARERKQSIRLLNTAQGTVEGYMKYVSTLFDSPRLKGLAQVGLVPLLNEWLSESSDAARDVAVFTAPDIWYTAGLTPVPNRILFLGTTNPAATEIEPYFEQQKAFWTGYAADLKQASKKKNVYSEWDEWALTHLSKVANDTGVFLEDQGDSQRAFEAYQEARLIATNNISALLNMLSLAQRESRPELPELQKDFDSLVSHLRGRLRVWSLANAYGYVRYPEFFAGRGWAWAMSGKPNVAISEMKRAVALGANEQQAQLSMASFYLMHQMTDESEKQYLKLYEEDPKNQPALFGLARVAMRKGDFDSARGYLSKLRELGASEQGVNYEQAVLEALAGNLAEAKRILNELVEANPKNLSAWTALTLVASEDGDDKTLDRALAVLNAAAPNSTTVLMTLAQVALSRNDLPAARRHVENVLRLQPMNRQALELIVELDMRESKRDLAEAHVETLMGIDPKNAVANNVLGSIQYLRGEYELAEASFRTALAARPESKGYNHLAWILQLKGRYAEALQMAEESLQRGPENIDAWDTKGVILMKLNRLDDALTALQKAVAAEPNNAHFILHMAQLYERKGMKDEAFRLADPLLARSAEMAPDAYDDLRALMKKLRGG